MRRDLEMNVDDAASVNAAEGQFDLQTLMRALVRQRRWIIVPTAVALLASAVFVHVVTPRYRAESRVLIESSETAYSRPEVDRGTDRDRPLLDAEALQSQVQLVLSRDLARRVLRDLDLAERTEFNPEADRSAFGRVLSLFGLAFVSPDMRKEERVLDRFYDRLSVFQVDRSRVIAITFRSEDPVLAAEVANAVTDGYLEIQQAAKADAMRQAGQWLAREIDQLRERVADAEARVEEFRSKSNLFVGSNNNPLSAQDLAEMNSQIVLARTQRAEAESKARLIREMIRTGQPIEASDIVNSELIRRLNEQRVTLQAQLAEQSSTLLPQHPRIKELKAQIADLEAQSRTEALKLVRSLENDARIVGVRLETLMANLDQAKQQASALGTEDVQLRALEREAKAQRDLLESFLSRYRDVTARETPDAIPADARVVSRAAPPSTLYFPKKLPIILIATLATMMCAISIVAVGELLSGESRFAAPLAMARAMPNALPPQAPATWIGNMQDSTGPPPGIERPELARQRQLSTLIAHVRDLGRGVVVVAGTDVRQPSAGLAVEVARELADQGKRTLLIDLDVAAAPAADIVADPRAPGLSDLLFGVATFAEVIQRDRASRIHVIATGRGVRDTVSLLTAEKLAIVFGAVSQTYDHVIVAAPALMRLPGVERLARFSRGVVLVAAEGREEAGADASDWLAGRGFANIVVVTMSPETLPGLSPDQVAA